MFRHREGKVGKDDLSGVFIFGYFRWRLRKPNNALHLEDNVEGVPYFVAQKKAYVDYSVMKRSTADLVGPYLEVGDLEVGSSEMERWLSGEHLEMDYISRCEQLGLKRAILKYPFSISFANDVADDLVGKHELNDDGLIAPLWTLDKMKSRFGKLDRPISSEELWPGVRGKVRLKTRILEAITR